MTPRRDKRALERAPIDPMKRPLCDRGRDRPSPRQLTDVSAVIVIIAVVAIILMIVPS
jgi:hypothetical protein